MPSFVQNTDLNSASFTLANGETGVIGRNATVTNLVGIPVLAGTNTGAGRPSLVVEGSLIGGFDTVFLAGADIRIGENGSVIAVQNSAAISNIFQTVNSQQVVAPLQLLNAGLIIGVSDGVKSNSSGTITNSGTIRAEIDNGLQIGAFTNIGAPLVVSITNSGQISGGFRGILIGNFAQNLVLTVVNTGEILGGQVGILAGSSAAGTTSIVNSGIIRGPLFALELREAADTVTNTGDIHGRVSMGSGSDRLDSSQGLLFGVVDGDDGADTLIGGRGDETLNGGDDNDVLRGNGGADRLEGGANDDTLYFDADDVRFGSVSGGTGYDTAYNTDESTPITVAMTGSSIEAFYGSNADEIIVAGSLGGFGAFVRAGAGNDLFDGSGQADNVDGGNGIDVLYGRGGADVLAGGLGGDWLQGGAGADVFDYNAGTDSTINGQDFIADFSTAEGDKINLDEALTNLGFATATFNTGFGTNASVYVFAQGGTSLVQVYTGATLQMQLVVSQASLAASDFVL